MWSRSAAGETLWVRTEKAAEPEAVPVPAFTQGDLDAARTQLDRLLGIDVKEEPAQAAGAPVSPPPPAVS